MPVRRSAVLALLACLILVLGACSGGGRTATVTHAAVTATIIDAGDPGPSVGDVRFFEIAAALEGSAAPARLDATLTTTGENVPNAGDEVRIGHLVFSFGAGTDQVVVDGTSVYPGAGSTIQVNSSTIRPIVGGSGAYAGARGWAESFHLADGTWRHVLHLLP
jgi:hypothetical protein